MPGYSDVLMDHFTHPRNQGHLEHPDGSGLVGTPGEGPFMLIQVRVRDGVIVDARFQTYGCGPTIAAGSLLTEMVRGSSVEACLGVTADALVAALGGVPPHKAHCPALAVGALRAALGAAGISLERTRSPEPQAAEPGSHFEPGHD